MDKLIDKLEDLHKQATEEKSHYYVGSVVRETIDYLKTQKDAVAESPLQCGVMTLVDLADKAHVALGAMREAATKALKETYGDTPDNNLVIVTLNEHLLRSTVALSTMAQLGREYKDVPEYFKKKGS